MNNLDDGQVKQLLLQSQKARKEWLNNAQTKIEFSSDGENWEYTPIPAWLPGFLYRVSTKNKFYAGDKIRDINNNEVYTVIQCFLDIPRQVTLLGSASNIPGFVEFISGDYLTDEHMDQFFGKNAWEVV